ncbi:uncharacterized protein LOC116338364, partial [Contarinia nasturtii]|uniref:uncharacterized protein LOC116338364 n=1 Tax=Contarinia nasturtii TaxID=265458 RepID=UPI0012D4AE5B
MPTEDNCTIKFENFKNQLRVPFIIYADIETYLKETNEQVFDSEKTKAYQKHEPYSIGYYFKSLYDDSQSYYKSKRGSDCIEWFVRELELIEKDIFPILNSVESMEISNEEEEMFETASECHICGEEFDDEDIKVRDHSHLSGRYRGPSHQSCNLKYQETRHIPVVFHNLSNYDSHFMISKIASGFEGDISIIPINDERYISFTKTVNNSDQKINYKEKIRFRFIDSFRFMADSLDKLSSYLTTTNKVILQKESHKCGFSLKQMQMLFRKGVFPYDYVTSHKTLKEKRLPPRSAFYNKLNESKISRKEYKFAQKMWKTFRINNLGEYSDLYLKTDVLLLADVFENFRDTCYKNYNLDPAHYFTAAGLSFDAMLKQTKVEIELLTDVDMLMFMEKGVRGGISQCSKRYSKANNKYINDYDATKESKYIMYLDANNLYGYSMMEYLPLNGFKWTNVKKFNDVNTILNIPHDSTTGYVFEVDLEYPQHLHDQHKDYPLCAERLILKKNHRAVKFNQSQWLKPYIDLNTELRKKATNEFEKNFFKLLCNSIYGKTMENIRDRTDIKLRMKWEGRYGIRKLISDPRFKKCTIFEENLAAVEWCRNRIYMNKPISIGMAVLDLSKILMYEFHYDHMKPQYGSNIQLMYTDTDSFIYEIKTDCFYEDMKKNLDRYDTSDYPVNNLFNIPQKNKKIPGLFKDEMKSKIV